MRFGIGTSLWGIDLCDGPLLGDFPFLYMLIVDAEVLMSALLVVG